jgi:hypothetical protein
MISPGGQKDIITTYYLSMETTTLTVRKRGTAVTKTFTVRMSELGSLKRLYLAAGYGIVSVSN